MLFITIIILIVAKALPVLNTQISYSQFSRLTSISLIFASFLLRGTSKGKLNKKKNLNNKFKKNKIFISRSHPMVNNACARERLYTIATSSPSGRKQRGNILKSPIPINGVSTKDLIFVSLKLLILGSIVLLALLFLIN
jgi:hypothetical protein